MGCGACRRAASQRQQRHEFELYGIHDIQTTSLSLMISRENYKSVRIHIITYKKSPPVDRNDKHITSIFEPVRKEHTNTMNKDKNYTKREVNNKEDNTKKYECPVCSNVNKIARNIDDSKKLTKLFSKTCELCLEKPKISNKHYEKLENAAKNAKSDMKLRYNAKRTKTIAVQTPNTDSNKNFYLLNEVLTVFQTNKELTKHNSKTVSHKDVSVSTESIPVFKPNLQISKVFQFSTDDPVFNKNDKSTIMTSHEDFVRSQYSIDLSKQKSSSIPQMKLEQIKYSVKEKSKPKDAVEEVNRMFANVRRKKYDSEQTNRPLVRSGPRCLPVVKHEDRASYSISRILSPCQFCHTDDFSSGDSCFRPDEFNHKEASEKDEKCVYMMCCHYKNCHKMQTGVVYCKKCRDESSFRCNHDNVDDNP